jgi:hypothetical protein
MLEITARDVIGTAHVNASYAAAELKRMLNATGDDLPPTEDQFTEIAHLLNRALSDVLWAQNQMSGVWTDATYLGIWSKV